MREIKSRVWDKTNRKMLYDSTYSHVEPDTLDDVEFEVKYLSFNDSLYSITKASWGIDSSEPVFISHDYEIMQYTGLKDKNDIEIYEGDILAVAHQKYLSVGDERFYRNGYANRAVKWRVTSHHNGWNIYDAPQTQFEVIGNIYENPELLGKEG